MGLLEGKTALVFGVANERSIAWGICQAFHRQGARLGMSYAGEKLERRVKPLAESLGVKWVESCDVSQDEQIEKTAESARAEFGEIDILVHCIAFAGREALSGAYYNTSRESFHVALDISVYSFTALARAFQPFLRPGGALLTMTYYGAEKVSPNYNVMGVAKAALEASVRYMAYDFGSQRIRVNAISAGPVRTLSAAGVEGFKALYRKFGEIAPLHDNVTIEDVGSAAVFLCSDMAAKTTGHVLYVDSGYNILGIMEPVDS
ncbi:MAG: enoyl-ACP reductase [Chloroflexi bacterium RBG_16_54_18]|nr:MAG: enoyl-ACP reductase [Chloroflexi bacterium RBG_16_54_18]